jgi:DNA polymerase-3 subunit epsilon
MDAPEVYELPQDLVFVDLETTGGNAAYHRITEVGIVRVENGAVIEEWSSLVNPECRIPSYIEGFTGITNEMVAAAPRFAEIAGIVLDKLRSCGAAGAPPLFVAHNARFDYAFLRAEFRRAGAEFTAKVLCTVKLSRRLYPQHRRHSLDAVMERHALLCSARHRALGDARVIGEFWLKLRRELPAAALADAAGHVLAAVRLPAHLPAGLADDLPEAPGVYRLYGPDDVLLFVGKGASLRSSVLAHFAGERAAGRSQRLKEQVRRIDWTETAGELGAALREIACVKTQQPLYNRSVKSSMRSFTIGVADHTGRAEIACVDELDPAQLESRFGVFHSPKDARKALIEIARSRMLCLKVLGLEESEGSCFASQMGKCKGACIGKEPLALHAVRVKMALASLKFKPWPFPGRVALRERGSMGGADLHVLDHWSYLGTARSEEELAEISSRAAPAAFDAQVYRILLRFLKSHPHVDWHELKIVEDCFGRA